MLSKGNDEIGRHEWLRPIWFKISYPFKSDLP